MSEIIQIEFLHLAFGYGLILLILLLVRIRKLGREWEIALATFRMTIQLVAVGYILDYIFTHRSPWITLGVFLPGMMTGQILSGVSPLTAIQYQIAIMIGIAGSVSITTFLATELGYRRFFNARDQIAAELYHSGT